MQEDDEPEEALPKVEFSPFGKQLAEDILKTGPITVAEYIGRAGQHYYASRDAIGNMADFFTAPELTQMFGELIGAWVADLWIQMGRPKKAQLIELGPGRGTLMADLLRTLSTWPDCLAAMSVHLVETSPIMREKQADKLKDYAPAWYDRVEDVPAGISFVVANEFFDALPTHQFMRVNKKWHETMINFDVEKGEFVVGIARDTVDLKFPKDYPRPMDRDVHETSPVGHAVLKTLCARLNAQGGAVLIFDYGYSEPVFNDTARSFRRHKQVSMLRNPGGQDVTADVDFWTFRNVAAPLVEVHGPVEQGGFLTRIGLEQRTEALCNAPGTTQEQRGNTRLSMRRLTSTNGFGDRFKVFAMTPKGSPLKPAGFSEDSHEIPDHGP